MHNILHISNHIFDFNFFIFNFCLFFSMEWISNNHLRIFPDHSDYRRHVHQDIRYCKNFFKLSQGCFKYFRKVINILDVFLISLNFFTILMYLKYHTTAQEIEDISFAFLIFLRNFSQLLRLVVLIKNQKSISV